MRTLQLYLDNCCFNRPFDDQNIITVFLETEAKLFIQDQIKNDVHQLVWSYVLDYENQNNPHSERRRLIADWKNRAIIDMNASEKIIAVASLLANRGLDQYDALHLSCAAEAKSDYFITTDKGILRNLSEFEGMKIVNPIQYIQIEVGR